MGLRENSRESILSLKNEFRDTTLKMSCEGQANANKLREIKDNLEGLDRDTRDKVSELQRMAATVEKLIRENKRNTEEFRDAKRNIEDLSEWKQEKEAKLQGMKSNLDSLSQEIKKNSDDLREFKITLEGLVQLTERKTNEIDRLKLNYEDLARETKKNANLQSKLRELESQLEGVKKDIIGRLDDIEDRLASVESEKAVEGDTPSLRRELKSLATTMEALKADVSSIKKDRETYTTRDNQLKQDLEKKVEDVKVLISKAQEKLKSNAKECPVDAQVIKDSVKGAVDDLLNAKKLPQELEKRFQYFMENSKLVDENINVHRNTVSFWGEEIKKQSAKIDAVLDEVEKCKPHSLAFTEGAKNSIKRIARESAIETINEMNLTLPSKTAHIEDKTRLTPPVYRHADTSSGRRPSLNPKVYRFDFWRWSKNLDFDRIESVTLPNSWPISSVPANHRFKVNYKKDLNWPRWKNKPQFVKEDSKEKLIESRISHSELSPKQQSQPAAPKKFKKQN
eukprot:TRINITY_DN798_c0_g2_i4.p1 TRINITY_DN798_c0_g2~~TRINITY_DN798_c0_g2_i4.p1  ORF type:complete len:510 (+),score=84.60 TRINITY_DN798_c0_g2_i4:680-2209(+)